MADPIVSHSTNLCRRETLAVLASLAVPASLSAFTAPLTETAVGAEIEKDLTPTIKREMERIKSRVEEISPEEEITIRAAHNQFQNLSDIPKTDKWQKSSQEQRREFVKNMLENTYRYPLLQDTPANRVNC